MANYYTDFSVELTLQSAEQVIKAIEISKELDEDEFDKYPFHVENRPEEPTVLWLHSDESMAVDECIAFVQRIAKEFGLKGKWGFSYSETCGAPRLNAFSGGAVLIDLETGETRSINATNWLEDQE